MEKLLYAPEEVAGLLHVGRSKVFELLRRGDIESLTIGRRRLIEGRAIQAYVARLREKQGAGAPGSAGT